jgi:hypothetical protein
MALSKKQRQYERSISSKEIKPQNAGETEGKR